MPNPPRATPTTRFAPGPSRLPPYSYVTGRFPHPIGDPRGHSFGQAPVASRTVPTGLWRDSQAFCFAVDLFNHGYYWEVHEVWESLWHAPRPSRNHRRLFQGRIKMAAAGVKAREGRPEGWRRHLPRTRPLAETQREVGPDSPKYFGLELTDLMAAVAGLDAGPPADAATDEAVHVVCPVSAIAAVNRRGQSPSAKLLWRH